MASLNKVQIIGNVGKDPEIRSFQNGGVVANFSVATSERWKDKTSGEKKERTQWHNIVVFNTGLVGIVEQFVRKGTRIYVEGQLETRKWQDQSGADRYVTEVVLHPYHGKILLLGGTKKETSAPPQPPNNDVYGATPPRPATDNDDFGFETGDEIPF